MKIIFRINTLQDRKKQQYHPQIYPDTGVVNNRTLNKKVCHLKFCERKLLHKLWKNINNPIKWIPKKGYPIFWENDF